MRRGGGGGEVRDSAVLRALASLLLVLFLAPRGSSPGSPVIPVALEPTFNYKF